MTAITEISEERATNIVPLTPEQKPPAPKTTRDRSGYRFVILPYTNPRSKTTSWRVTGTKRDGTRIRENYSGEKEAQDRRSALEIEWLSRETPSNLRQTRLTEEQVEIAEACFKLVEEDAHLLTAVHFWIAHGKQQIKTDAPKLDDAFEQFKTWVDGSDSMRHLTKIAAKWRVEKFVNQTHNVRVSEITPEIVERFLDKIPKRRSRINYKGGLSKFFSWCMDRNRRWIITNPCAAVKVEAGEPHTPEVLSVDDCERIIREAEKFKDGAMVPYFALAMFEGLRPFEARRVTWAQINFEDGEIRIEGHQTKTKRSRSFALSETGLAWLRAYKHLAIKPKNFQNDLPVLLAKAGFGKKTEESPNLRPWTKDVLRHTSISHSFRSTGSYGKTAERFGNSEAVIKRHYQGRVTSADTAKFYALRPSR